jgi:O-acetyl-ADP-ribose deacetylase (regulator of RNase III)
MIHYVSGDILLTKAQAIAHGVAPNDPMNQGLALSLHQKYPAMHKDFHHWCNQHHAKPGEAWLWGGTDGVRIVNLLTQEASQNHSHPGKASIKLIRDSLRSLAKIVASESLSSIALSRLATGVGGMQWNDVKPVIENELGNLTIPVYVYAEYHAGVAANEH